MVSHTACVAISCPVLIFQGITHNHILREGAPITYHSLAKEGTSNIEPKAWLVDLIRNRCS